MRETTLIAWPNFWSILDASSTRRAKYQHHVSACMQNECAPHSHANRSCAPAICVCVASALYCDRLMSSRKTRVYGRLGRCIKDCIAIQKILHNIQYFIDAKNVSVHFAFHAFRFYRFVCVAHDWVSVFYRFRDFRLTFTSAQVWLKSYPLLQLLLLLWAFIYECRRRQCVLIVYGFRWCFYGFHFTQIRTHYLCAGSVCHSHFAITFAYL